MAFQMCPDDGPNRLYRYVEPGVLPVGVLAELDVGTNVLRIDRECFSSLSDTQQRALMKTNKKITYAPSNKVYASV